MPEFNINFKKKVITKVPELDRNVKVGVRYNKYLIISYIAHNKWKCKCDCGNITEVFACDLYSSKSKGCRNCSNGLSKGVTGFNNLYSKYFIRARDHKRSFNLTKDEFRKLTSGNCHYCNIAPYKISTSGSSTSKTTKLHSAYTYNGIDRKDSSIGYIIDNCITCCEICNKAKRNMSYDTFINYLKQIDVKYAKQY